MNPGQLLHVVPLARASGEKTPDPDDLYAVVIPPRGNAVVFVEREKAIDYCFWRSLITNRIEPTVYLPL